MSQPDFDALAETVLEQIQEALETSGIDVDVEAKADGVIELEFEDGSKMVINRHRAAREIWVAARAGGFHFRWDGTAWRDTRDGAELFAALSRLVSAQGGTPVVLAAPRRHGS
jgi:CyaY protein